MAWMIARGGEANGLCKRLIAILKTESQLAIEGYAYDDEEFNLKP